ncbi:MAG: hypothetical protein AAF773_15890 [Cyanobacteria bacterium P01_D01_bin.115]
MGRLPSLPPPHMFAAPQPTRSGTARMAIKTARYRLGHEDWGPALWELKAIEYKHRAENFVHSVAAGKY